MSGLRAPPFVDTRGRGQHPSVRMLSSFRQRLSALLMLPVLLYAGLARGGELFRCRSDEIVRESCCCPNQRTPDSKERTLRTVASSCCDVRTIDVDKSPKDSPRISSVVPPLEGTPLGDPLQVVAELLQATTMASWTAVDTSPPILRRTCSLLI
jgi:hypothetical protein